MYSGGTAPPQDGSFEPVRTPAPQDDPLRSSKSPGDRGDGHTDEQGSPRAGHDRYPPAHSGARTERAIERLGTDLVLAAPFHDVAVIDPTVRRPRSGGLDDSGAHLEERPDFADEAPARYGLDLTVTHPGPGAASAPCGSTRRCGLRMVVPCASFSRASWHGSPRDGRRERTAAPVVSWDAASGLVR